MEERKSCPCCKHCNSCQENDFQKILHLKDTGIVTYKYKLNPEHGPVLDDIYIIQNTRDTDVSQEAFLQEFEKQKVDCARCKKLMNQTEEVLTSVKTMKKNEIKSICEQCRHQIHAKFPCEKCEKAAKRFLSTIEKLVEIPNPDLQSLIDQHNLLKRLFVKEPGEPCSFCTETFPSDILQYSDLYLLPGSIENETYHDTTKRQLNTIKKENPELFAKLQEQQPDLFTFSKRGSEDFNTLRRQLEYIKKEHPEIIYKTEQKHPQLFMSKAKSESIKRQLIKLKEENSTLFAKLEKQHPDLFSSRSPENAYNLKRKLDVIKSQHPNVFEKALERYPNLFISQSDYDNTRWQLDNLKEGNPELFEHMKRQFPDLFRVRGPTDLHKLKKQLQFIKSKHPNEYAKMQQRDENSEINRTKRQLEKVKENNPELYAHMQRKFPDVFTGRPDNVHDLRKQLDLIKNKLPEELEKMQHKTSAEISKDERNRGKKVSLAVSELYPHDNAKRQIDNFKEENPELFSKLQKELADLQTDPADYQNKLDFIRTKYPKEFERSLQKYKEAEAKIYKPKTDVLKIKPSREVSAETISFEKQKLRGTERRKSSSATGEGIGRESWNTEKESTYKEKAGVADKESAKDIKVLYPPEKAKHVEKDKGGVSDKVKVGEKEKATGADKDRAGIDKDATEKQQGGGAEKGEAREKKHVKGERAEGDKIKSVKIEPGGGVDKASGTEKLGGGLDKASGIEKDKVGGTENDRGVGGDKDKSKGADGQKDTSRGAEKRGAADKDRSGGAEKEKLTGTEKDRGGRADNEKGKGVEKERGGITEKERKGGADKEKSKGDRVAEKEKGRGSERERSDGEGVGKGRTDKADKQRDGSTEKENAVTGKEKKRAGKGDEELDSKGKEPAKQQIKETSEKTGKAEKNIKGGKKDEKDLEPLTMQEIIKSKQQKQKDNTSDTRLGKKARLGEEERLRAEKSMNSKAKDKKEPDNRTTKDDKQWVSMEFDLDKPGRKLKSDPTHEQLQVKKELDALNRDIIEKNIIVIDESRSIAKFVDLAKDRSEIENIKKETRAHLVKHREKKKQELESDMLATKKNLDELNMAVFTNVKQLQLVPGLHYAESSIKVNVKDVKMRRASIDDTTLLSGVRTNEQVRPSYAFLQTAKIKGDSSKGSSRFSKSKRQVKLVRDEMIVGGKIVKRKGWIDPDKIPPDALLFHNKLSIGSTIDIAGHEEDSESKQLAEEDKNKKVITPATIVEGSGTISYALSDRTFIDKGWTVLPEEKVVRKVNIYRMRPSHPEFNWFENNKKRGIIFYETGEKLADFKEPGKASWYYRNGKIALDYYDAEEVNAGKRFVVYSNGEKDELGRPRPVTVLASFDYLGNGIVFDHSGKIRVKYNQHEGVSMDSSLGPTSHWKWNDLNDPPVLQQVMIDTQLRFKDPDIVKIGMVHDNNTHEREDDDNMLAVEFENFLKYQNRKVSKKKYKSFPIIMKALKLNENFSLRIVDQSNMFLMFRDGPGRLKINLGLVLDQTEIIDTDTADLGEITNTMERMPASTDSVAWLQKTVKRAQNIDKYTCERNERINPSMPVAEADIITAGLSKPLCRPLMNLTPHSSTYSNLYYSTYSMHIY